MKNKLLASGMKKQENANDRILAHKPSESADDKPKVNLKNKDEVDRERIRKRERKALMKSLQMAQMSTASMGKFDKKATKTEVNLNSSKFKKVKKSNNKLCDIEKHMGKGNVEK